MKKSGLIIALIAAVVIIAALVLRTVRRISTGLAFSLSQAVLGIGVIIALVIIVLWMFWYASKH